MKGNRYGCAEVRRKEGKCMTRNTLPPGDYELGRAHVERAEVGAVRGAECGKRQVCPSPDMLGAGCSAA